jgi:tetratricopeptide (TPR) repeat protein
MKIVVIIFFLISSLTSFAFQNDPSIKKLKETLKEATIQSDKIALNRKIAFYYFDRQVYFDSAYFYLKKTYDLALKIKDSTALGWSLFDQALILDDVGYYVEAIKMYEKAVEISEKIKDPNIKVYSYHNIANINADKFKNYEKAKEIYKKVIIISKDEELEGLLGSTYGNLGTIALEEGYYKKAIKLLTKGDSILNKTNRNSSYFLIAFAKANKQIGNIDIAKSQGLKTYDMSLVEGDLQTTYNSAMLLSNIYKDENKFDTSLEYMTIASHYKDSIVKAKELNEIQKLKLNIEIKEQKNIVKNLEQKNKYLTTIYIFLLLQLYYSFSF